MDIVKFLASEELNETVTLIINVVTFALAFRFRKPFKERYSGAGRFYDALVLASAVWLLGEALYAPGYFPEYFSEEFAERTAWIADNVWIVFQLLFLYAFASLFRTLIEKYRVEVALEPSASSPEVEVCLSPGTYVLPVGREKEVFTGLAQGMPGLIISRSHPERTKKRFGLEKTPVLWLL